MAGGDETTRGDGFDEGMLRGAFAEFGEIVSVRVMRYDPGNRSRGFGYVRFREAAAAFDAGAGGRGGLGGIDWGAAEAHLWVGRCARDAGDAAAARKAFERSLAIAPDFVAAKRALGR